MCDIRNPAGKIALPPAEEVREGLERALKRLTVEDEYLFRVNVNERTLTHKLEEYLQCHFEGWNVDCEYNRNGVERKKLRNLSDCHPEIDDEDGCTVFPDIIVHKRGRSEDGEPTRNLLVIEAKKSSNKTDAKKDHDKLRLYKQELRYQHSAFVVFAVKTSRAAWKLEFDPE